MAHHPDVRLNSRNRVRNNQVKIIIIRDQLQYMTNWNILEVNRNRLTFIFTIRANWRFFSHFLAIEIPPLAKKALSGSSHIDSRL